MTSRKRRQWARVFISARHHGLVGLSLLLFSLECARQAGSVVPLLVALRVMRRIAPRRGQKARPTWHLPPTWAPRALGVIAVGIALWGLLSLHPKPIRVEPSFEVIPYQDTTDDDDDWLTEDRGTRIAVPMPLKRMNRQQAAPCAPPPSGEVEINGACWVHLNKSLPCGNQFYEHDGKCYVPVRETPRPPTSVKP
jgi:hypothetical protein